ncbi:MAG TPA: Rrf2 family transcriptional regulator [Gemmataceae bacterium]|nr:Rrf2 family transcriptional regulator [Gemmataceae bacterium]
MIPKTAEYALRAVVVLAREPQRAYAADQIAEATRVPRRYAHKVLQALVRAELVRSQSGPGGGYALVRPPEELSILDVVSAVEPIPRIRHCPLGLKSHTSLCPLHHELDEACAATERAFARVTIAQLLAPSSAVPPLCEAEPNGKAQLQEKGKCHERPNRKHRLRA